MTKGEERINAGIGFYPGAPELKAFKVKAHNLDTQYNATFEDEVEKRAEILKKLVGEMGDPGASGVPLRKTCH